MDEHQAELGIGLQRALPDQRQRLFGQARQIVDHHDDPGREQAAADQIGETSIGQFGSVDLGQFGIGMLAASLGDACGDGPFREQGLSALDEQGAAENRRLCHRSIVPSGAVDCHPHLTRTQETQLKASRSEPRA
ncbi:hypothetical protein SDC9_164700 [bioreactor metagenome]|uniref:Uncharacterized protein n=1 Tax=bioreactor metagenome TaxID=1076179 RepID=A0A645FSD4_9ZZZZ